MKSGAKLYGLLSYKEKRGAVLERNQLIEISFTGAATQSFARGDADPGILLRACSISKIAFDVAPA